MNKMKQHKNNAYNAYLNFRRFYDGKCYDSNFGKNDVAKIQIQNYQ